MKKRLFLLLLTILYMAVHVKAAEKVSENRIDEVTKRGKHVMPFSLEQTVHVFSKTENGGLQQVIVKDGSNIDQINLIRQHLTKISGEFKQGNFSDPAKIHGEDMPGLKELKATKPGQIKIVFKELPNGAEINYITDDMKLIEAIHNWFDAQLKDHAHHAVSSRHHLMHHKP